MRSFFYFAYCFFTNCEHVNIISRRKFSWIWRVVRNAQLHELHKGDISPLSIGHNLDAEWAICILYMRLQRIYRNYYFMPPSSDNHRQGLKWLPKSGGASSNTVVMWRGAPAAGACYSAKNLSPWLIWVCTLKPLLNSAFMISWDAKKIKTALPARII